MSRPQDPKRDYVAHARALRSAANCRYRVKHGDRLRAEAARRRAQVPDDERQAHLAKRRAAYAESPERIREAVRGLYRADPVVARTKQRVARRRRVERDRGEGVPREHLMYERKVRAAQLRRQFGLTVAQYDAMVTAQDGLCAICRRPETRLDHRTKRVRRLAVDHCHTSKRVRGLLCCACNTAIGLLKDSPRLLTAARQYLEAPSRADASADGA